MNLDTPKIHESIFYDAASMVHSQLNASGISLSNLEREELAATLENFIASRSATKIDVLRSADGHPKPILSSPMANFISSHSLNSTGGSEAAAPKKSIELSWRKEMTAYIFQLSPHR